MKEMNSDFRNIKGWAEHIELLQQHLNIPQIINEFQNKNISFFNGLCGFYYLLRKIGKSNEYKDLILSKIQNSNSWDELLENKDEFKESIGLYKGLPGVILTYLHILHNSDSAMFFDSVISQSV